MHPMLLTTHIRRPLARLVAHMTQESPRQTTQTPGSLRTRVVRPATGHPQLSLFLAVIPNYSSDKHVSSFVHPSPFDARDVSTNPWYHPDTRGIFSDAPRYLIHVTTFLFAGR